MALNLACHYLVLFVLIWYGLVAYVLYSGSILVIEGEKYDKESTEERCFVVEYSAAVCTYSCRCNDDGCSTCFGTQYEYVATCESKCGDQLLYSHDLDEGCPMEMVNIQKETKCYVLDCKEAEFTFTHPAARMAGGVGLLVLGICMVFAPLVYIVKT
eukprot:624156_1